MQKLTLNLVKLFIVHAKDSNILELDINELRENFRIFKNKEKYQALLSSYDFEPFNEDHICRKLESEINILIAEKKIIKNKNMLYIYNVKDISKELYSHKINKLVDEMVVDYINLNMSRAKQKVKGN